MSGALCAVDVARVLSAYTVGGGPMPADAPIVSAILELDDLSRYGDGETPFGMTLSEDGALLNWLGENYVRQSAPVAPMDVDSALDYARRYWQFGQEPESQAALTILAHLVTRAMDRDGTLELLAEERRRAERHQLLALHAAALDAGTDWRSVEDGPSHFHSSRLYPHNLAAGERCYACAAPEIVREAPGE